MSKKIVPFQVMLSEEEYKELIKCAALEDRSKGSVMRVAFKKYLKEKK